MLVFKELFMFLKCAVSLIQISCHFLPPGGSTDLRYVLLFSDNEKLQNYKIPNNSTTNEAGEK
jgi:hypothetical protein